MKKIYGINNDSETCSCCGRTGLKRVVWIGDTDGEPAPFGVNCAANILGVTQKTKARTEAAVENAMIAQVVSARSALVQKFVNCGGYAIPQELFNRHDLTLEEKLAERKRLYPVFDESLSYADRVKYV